MTDLAKQIFDIATEHNGKYLLHRRYRKTRLWEEPTELDKEYAACDELVSEGYAYWLQTQQSPGIMLSGKPILNQQSKDRP